MNVERKGLPARLLAAAAALLLAACGGGGDAPAEEPRPAILANAPVYGTASEPLPAGYEQVALDEVERLAAQGTLEWVTPDSLLAGVERTRSRQAAARARVEAAAAQSPRLAELLTEPKLGGPGIVRRADGSAAWRLDPSSSDPPVALDAPRYAVYAAAHALEKAASRDNTLAVYRMHWDALAADARAELPTPEAAAGLGDAALQQAVSTAAARVIETVPNVAPLVTLAPAGPSRARALSTAASGVPPTIPGCTPLPDGSLISDASFTLKPYLPSARDQGGRGSCVSFAILGAMETRIARLYNRRADLSEQLLYSIAKGQWQTESDDYGDGLVTGWVLDDMLDPAHWVRGEGEWRYNPSWDRQELDFSERYRKSCDGYDETCSDTNHQAGRKCVGVQGAMFCFRYRPGTDTAIQAERYRLQSYASLGSLVADGPGSQFFSNLTLQNVQAVLQAGRPVVLDMVVPDCFKLLRNPGKAFGAYVKSQDCNVGDYEGAGERHAMLIVGYVPNFEVLARYGQDPEFPGIEGHPINDGYYIVRNSWGCGWGDAGYAYMSGQALRRHGIATYVVNGVLQQNLPTLFLSSNRTLIDAPGETATLTAQPAPSIRRVEFFAEENGAWTPLSTDQTAPFQHGFQAAYFHDRIGKRNFFARGYDEGGNVVASQVLQLDVRDTVIQRPTLTVTLTQVGRTAPLGSTIVAPALVRVNAVVTPGTLPPLRIDFFKGPNKVGQIFYKPEKGTEPYFWSVPITADDVGVLGLGARVVDNRSFSTTRTVLVNVTAGTLPTLSGFKSTPATAPPGGGPVTLSWTAGNFQSLAIDKVGPVTSLSSVVVSPNVTTTYTLTASNAAGSKTASTTVTVPPPRIDSFTASPSTLPVGGGPVTLSWSVTGAASVLIGNGVGVVPGNGSRVVDVVGNTSWTLSAQAPSGTRTATAGVAVGADNQPPSVSLVASPTTVDAPGSVTLTATATDNVGVVAVDFYRGASRIATDSTPGDGFTHGVGLTSADEGNRSFSAVARDAAGLTATSLPVVVTVRVPLGVDRWVAPTGNDSQSGSQAAPYLTVGKALANIGASGTVWLAPGSYPWANEINRNGYSQLDTKVLRIPDTGRVRAITRGTATLNFGLQALGSAVISGVHFTLLAGDVSDWQPSVLSKAAAGTLRVERATFGRMNNLQTSAGGNTLLTTEGDTTHEWFTPEFQGAFGRVDLGQTRIVGGRITLTRIPDGGNAGVRTWGSYGGSGVLSFESLQMTLPEAPANVAQVVFTPIGGGTLTFFSSQVVQQGTRTSHVLAQNDHLSQVRLLNSTVSGPFGQIVSLTAGGNVEVNGSTLSGGVTGIGFAGGQEPGGVTMPSVQILDSTLRNFSAHGLYLPNHGNVLVSGSTLRDNGQSGVFLGGLPALPWVTANYVLRVQTSTFSGNGSGGPNDGGLVLAGSGTSTWDLGGFNGNGDNTLLGSTNGPALRVAVSAGSTVLAVGNTWTPSVQGANASGRYVGELQATSGSGTNYTVTRGTLQLGY